MRAVPPSCLTGIGGSPGRASDPCMPAAETPAASFAILVHSGASIALSRQNSQQAGWTKGSSRGTACARAGLRAGGWASSVGTAL